MHKDLSESLFEEQTKFCHDERLLSTRKWATISRSYPVLVVEFKDEKRAPIRVSLNCDDWDETPPSIDLLEASGVPLQNFPSGHGAFNNSRHPKTMRPFICLPGSREYHTHPSHINDRWENYRGKTDYDLGGIITQIWNAWKLTK